MRRILAAPATPDGGANDSDARRISLNVDGELSSPLALAMSLPPPQMARRTIAHASSRGRGTECNDGVPPPPILKRRTLSYDHGGRDQPRDQRAAMAGTTTAPRAEEDADAAVRRRDDHDDHHDHHEGQPARRNTLIATPLRSLWNNRSRAASCDIVLNISDDCLPRYCDDLASRIASISDAEATGGMQEQGQGQEQVAFSTPQRPANAANNHRGRANTCPHRPQRHSMVQQGRDEEAGWQLDEVPTLTASSSPAGSRGVQSSPDEEEEAAAALGSRPRSPERRGHWSPTSPRIRRTLASSPLASPLLSTGIPAATRPPPPSPSLAPSDAPSIAVPTVLQVSHRSSRSLSSPTTSTRGAVAGALTNPTSSTPNCFLRMNPALMKLLMVFSLYMLLAYTWNTDLKVRFKSMEINYGLSAYWHGEGEIRTENTQIRSHRKLSNDGGDGIIKLINELVEKEDQSEDSEETRGEDEEGALLSLHSTLSSDKRKRRPSLSYARSSASFHGPRRAAALAAARRRPPEPKWTLSKMAWCLVWMAFLLPIVEAAAREARRQVNFRFWRVRRLRSLRAAPSRVPNVHDL